MNKYICVRELIFRLFRDMNLGRLCSNSLIANATMSLISREMFAKSTHLLNLYPRKLTGYEFAVQTGF